MATKTNNREPMETGYLTGLLFFGSIHSPSNKFNTNKYVLQLGLEGEELKKATVDYKMNVKPATEHVPLPHVEIKRNVKSDATKAPTVIDALNQPIPKTVLVGNKSKVKVKFGLYDNTKGKNAGYLDTVKVLNLVEYVPRSEEDRDFYEVEDGSAQTVDDTADTDEAQVPTEVKKKAVVKITDEEIPF